MQVRAGCPAGSADLGNLLSLRNPFAVLHKRCGEVRINGKVTAVMRDNHGIAVAAEPIIATIGDISRSVSRRAYRAAVICRDINSAVRVVPPLVIAEIAGNCAAVKREYKIGSYAAIVIDLKRFQIFDYRYII